MAGRPHGAAGINQLEVLNAETLTVFFLFMSPTRTRTSTWQINHASFGLHDNLYRTETLLRDRESLPLCIPSRKSHSPCLWAAHLAVFNNPSANQAPNPPSSFWFGPNHRLQGCLSSLSRSTIPYISHMANHAKFKPPGQIQRPTWRHFNDRSVNPTTPLIPMSTVP